MPKPKTVPNKLLIGFSDDQLARLDKWRRTQEDLPTRSEIVRRLVDGGLQSPYPLADWKGFLRLSLVTCHIAMVAATSDTELSFGQINKRTGHSIRYVKVDAKTGEEVADADIVDGYKSDSGASIQVTQDELDAIAPASTQTIEIEEFVPRSEVDSLYGIRPYFIVPAGQVGQDAFAVIRETIRALDKVALARVTLTNRERMIALEPRGKGMVGTLLRYPYEVRDPTHLFDDVQDTKVSSDMIELAKNIVERKAGPFEPKKFEDYHKAALLKLLAEKQTPADGTNVIDLIDALKKSLAGERG